MMSWKRQKYNVILPRQNVMLSCEDLNGDLAELASVIPMSSQLEASPTSSYFIVVGFITSPCICNPIHRLKL